MLEWLKKLLGTKEPPAPASVYAPSPVAIAIVDAFKKRRKDFTFSVDGGEFKKINQKALEHFLYSTKYNDIKVVSVIDAKTNEMFKFSFRALRTNPVLQPGCGGFDGLCHEDVSFVLRECENVLWSRLKPSAKRLGGKAANERSDAMKSQIAYEQRKKAVYKHLEKVYCND